MSAIRKHQTDEGMNGDEAADFEAVRRAVSSWPPARRAALIHDILDSLVGETKPTQQRRKTLQEAFGIIKVDPPPTDEQVEQWLDEHRMEKYGQ